MFAMMVEREALLEVVSLLQSSLKPGPASLPGVLQSSEYLPICFFAAMDLPLIDDYFVNEGHTLVQKACILKEKITGCPPTIGVFWKQGVKVSIVLCIVIDKMGQKLS